MKTNIIYNKDCLVGLKDLPDNSIDCCVTSPPYFNLRDYGVDGQIGLEDTPEAYIQKLVYVYLMKYIEYCDQMGLAMPKKPKLSHFTRMSIWAQKERQAKENKCCGIVLFTSEITNAYKSPMPISHQQVKVQNVRAGYMLNKNQFTIDHYENTILATQEGVVRND